MKTLTPLACLLALGLMAGHAAADSRALTPQQTQQRMLDNPAQRSTQQRMQTNQRVQQRQLELDRRSATQQQNQQLRSQMQTDRQRVQQSQPGNR